MPLPPRNGRPVWGSLRISALNWHFSATSTPKWPIGEIGSRPFRPSTGIHSRFSENGGPAEERFAGIFENGPHAVWLIGDFPKASHCAIHMAEHF